MLAIALLVSVLGSFVTYAHARSAYARQTTLAQAQQQVDALLRTQIDQETGLRGYLASGERTYLQPYYEAQPRFSAQLSSLQRSMQDARLTETLPLIFDVGRNHQIWERDVALPLIARPTAPDEVDRMQKGKLLVDQMRLDLAQITGILNSESEQAADAVRKLLLRSATLTAALMLLFGTSAIIADVIRTRTQVALERERIVGDTLQRAFLSGWDVLPYLRVGT
ncbi:MAG TPA: CHASE3 domain-containing protein, partial [Candidatus Eremiobacteraceae bacterium]|nr:CHASE3 domain-containing protein [Candidatus Eremiobacteraceae bacterium]